MCGRVAPQWQLRLVSAAAVDCVKPQMALTAVDGVENLRGQEDGGYKCKTQTVLETHRCVTLVIWLIIEVTVKVKVSMHSNQERLH